MVLELGEGFLTGIVFVIVYLATNNIVAAVWIAIAMGFFWQFTLLDYRGRSVDVMQYLNIGLVVALGAISFAFNNPRFVLLKPSAVHFATAAVMLRRGWIARYMPPIVTQNLSECVPTATGYVSASLMVALGILNTFIANSFSIVLWT